MKTKKKTQTKPASSKVCYADSDEVREEYKGEGVKKSEKHARGMGKGQKETKSE